LINCLSYFYRKDDAARAIEAVDGTNYEGKIIRATFGTFVFLFF
jgi:hypothetical protein